MWWKGDIVVETVDILGYCRRGGEWSVTFTVHLSSYLSKANRQQTGRWIHWRCETTGVQTFGTLQNLENTEEVLHFTLKPVSQFKCSYGISPTHWDVECRQEMNECLVCAFNGKSFSSSVKYLNKLCCNGSGFCFLQMPIGGWNVRFVLVDWTHSLWLGHNIHHVTRTVTSLIITAAEKLAFINPHLVLLQPISPASQFQQTSLLKHSRLKYYKVTDSYKAFKVDQI